MIYENNPNLDMLKIVEEFVLYTDSEKVAIRAIEVAFEISQDPKCGKQMISNCDRVKNGKL